MDWIPITEGVPKDGERVLAFLPKNIVYLPGGTGASKLMPVIFLRFAENFFGVDNPKREKFGAHFWLGEGQSNQYFSAVTHWMPAPAGPQGEVEKLMDSSQ